MAELRHIHTTYTEKDFPIGMIKSLLETGYTKDRRAISINGYITPTQIEALDTRSRLY